MVAVWTFHHGEGGCGCFPGEAGSQGKTESLSDCLCVSLRSNSQPKVPKAKQTEHSRKPQQTRFNDRPQILIPSWGQTEMTSGP